MKLPMATLVELLGFHYERREWLYRFLEQLTPEELTRDLKVGWRSIRGILVHSLAAESFWVEHRLQKGERPNWDEREYGDITAIRALAARVRGKTEAYLAGLTEEDLGREESMTFSSGDVVRFTVAKALTHVVIHDAHHRGQVSTLARQLGYEPPEIDLL